jgi:hypothetical protein
VTREVTKSYFKLVAELQLLNRDNVVMMQSEDQTNAGKRASKVNAKWRVLPHLIQSLAGTLQQWREVV